jgi:hypothetical protein
MLPFSDSKPLPVFMITDFKKIVIFKMHNKYTVCISLRLSWLHSVPEQRPFIVLHKTKWQAAHGT